MQRHRDAIDGLRAVAVLLIVLYHAGVPHVGGGFIGVDVFFVLSGFLITSQLVEARSLPFKKLIREFYARRARRILPALALVTLVTLIVGRLVLLPSGEQQDLSKSALASSLFLSNVYFMKVATNYFAGPSELQPLLHTWSLSVEEQFYLFWPLWLTALWALGTRVAHRRPEAVVTGGIAAATVASFFASAHWAATAPSVAFFATPSRVWELGCGALLSQFLRGRSRGVPRGFVIGILGAIAIASAGVLFTRETQFPGFAALAPVMGTCLLIIAAHSDETTGVTRFLSLKPMRFVGGISYSWYLWHWPLLAIARTADLGQHNLGRDVGLIILAFGLAAASTLWFENPIRFQQVQFVRGATKSLWMGAVATAIVLVSAGFEWKTARQYYRYALAPLSWGCAEKATFSTSGPCLLSLGAKGPVYLTGDSHADHWSAAIAQWAKSVDATAIERALPSCPTLLAAYVDQKTTSDGFYFPPGCQAFALAAMHELRSTAEKRGSGFAILAVHWNSLVSGSSSVTKTLRPALDNALDSLDRSGVRVVVIGQTPEFDYAIPACVARRGADFCRVTRIAEEDRNEAVNVMLRSAVASHTNARLWEPTQSFCDARWCYPVKGDMLLFRDKDHLTPGGALTGGRLLDPVLNWLFEGPPLEGNARYDHRVRNAKGAAALIHRTSNGEGGGAARGE